MNFFKVSDTLFINIGRIEYVRIRGEGIEVSFASDAAGFGSIVLVSDEAKRLIEFLENNQI